MQKLNVKRFSERKKEKNSHKVLDFFRESTFLLYVGAVINISEEVFFFHLFNDFDARQKRVHLDNEGRKKEEKYKFFFE
jgi:hypothetical protein